MHFEVAPKSKFVKTCQNINRYLKSQTILLNPIYFINLNLIRFYILKGNTNKEQYFKFKFNFWNFQQWSLFYSNSTFIGVRTDTAITICCTVHKHSAHHSSNLREKKRKNRIMTNVFSVNFPFNFKQCELLSLEGAYVGLFGAIEEYVFIIYYFKNLKTANILLDKSALRFQTNQLLFCAHLAVTQLRFFSARTI